MTQALLFYCAGDDGRSESALREELAQHCAEIDFRVWPDVGERHDVHYAAVWNPPPTFFQGLTELRAVLALSAGVDRLLSDPALPRDVPVVRLEDAGMAETMAEYVLYGVLHAQRRMTALRQAQHEARWVAHIHAPSAQQVRVGILGAGVLGLAVAERLAMNGYPVTCWSRAPKHLPAPIENVAGDKHLYALAASSEVLVCLLPLTERTRGILNTSLFNAMPRGSFLINAARGGHLIETDLSDAIQHGQLAGALLDVLQEEPPSPDHPFFSETRILLTPHIAAPSPPQASAEQACTALRALLNGRVPPGLVDRQSGY